MLWGREGEAVGKRGNAGKKTGRFFDCQKGRDGVY